MFLDIATPIFSLCLPWNLLAKRPTMRNLRGKGQPLIGGSVFVKESKHFQGMVPLSSTNDDSIGPFSWDRVRVVHGQSSCTDKNYTVAILSFTDTTNGEQRNQNKVS